MKTLKSHKLFYNKYLYRLQIRNELANYFREKNFTVTRNTIDRLQRLYDQNQLLVLERGLRAFKVSEDAFFDAKRLYNIFLNYDDFKLRIETFYINVYSNNKSWLNTVAKNVNKQAVISFYEPDPKYLGLLKEDTIIIEKDIGFEYKVTLGNNKHSSRFAEWAKLNPKQIKLGPIAYKDMAKDSYVNGLYFYAKNEKTLQLCSLMLDSIRRVDKLIVMPNIDK